MLDFTLFFFFFVGVGSILKFESGSLTMQLVNDTPYDFLIVAQYQLKFTS